MAEAASLMEKYKGAGSNDPSSSAEFRQQILSFKPQWDKYETTRSCAGSMESLELGAPALQTKQLLEGNLALLKACMDSLALQDDNLLQWVLTLFYDMLREDSSCFSLFEDALGQAQISVYKPLMALLGRQDLEAYIADKAAWLLTAVTGHVPIHFSDQDVKSMLGKLLPSGSCTAVGKLEAITNLLKADTFRRMVWSTAGVPQCIFKIQPKTDPSPYLYRCVFGMWMLSFDAEIMADLKAYDAIKTMKDILTYSRTEKVVRLCLTVLKNFLAQKALCEEIVEAGLLEAVQQLEYEKWRDADLYDDIREMAGQISIEVQEMSNFDRYSRELQTGTLQWGFVHSSKFWAENVFKFEQNDFRALKVLAGLLLSTDATTRAVACHDLGEFVTLHPLGKKKIAQLQVKERVMELMSSTDAGDREVRREALLCCQKIMLNKWQEIDSAK